MRSALRAALARGTNGASAEHLVQFGAGISLSEFGEGSLLRDLACRAHETAPRRSRQRTADADAANAKLGGLLDRKTGSPDQEIDRFGMHGLYDRRDLLPGFDARRIKTIRSRLDIGGQPVDHHVQIGLPDQKALTAPGQQNPAPVSIDRRARRLDALDRERAFVKRLRRIAGGILD